MKTSLLLQILTLGTVALSLNVALASAPKHKVKKPFTVNMTEFVKANQNLSRDKSEAACYRLINNNENIGSNGLIFHFDHWSVPSEEQLKKEGTWFSLSCALGTLDEGKLPPEMNGLYETITRFVQNNKDVSVFRMILGMESEFLQGVRDSRYNAFFKNLTIEAFAGKHGEKFASAAIQSSPGTDASAHDVVNTLRLARQSSNLDFKQIVYQNLQIRLDNGIKIKQEFKELSVEDKKVVAEALLNYLTEEAPKKDSYMSIPTTYYREQGVALRFYKEIAPEILSAEVWKKLIQIQKTVTQGDSAHSLNQGLATVLVASNYAGQSPFREELVNYLISKGLKYSFNHKFEAYGIYDLLEEKDLNAGIDRWGRALTPSERQRIAALIPQNMEPCGHDLGAPCLVIAQSFRAAMAGAQSEVEANQLMNLLFESFKLSKYEVMVEYNRYPILLENVIRNATDALVQSNFVKTSTLISLLTTNFQKQIDLINEYASTHPTELPAPLNPQVRVLPWNQLSILGSVLHLRNLTQPERQQIFSLIQKASLAYSNLVAGKKSTHMQNEYLGLAQDINTFLILIPGGQIMNLSELETYADIAEQSPYKGFAPWTVKLTIVENKLYSQRLQSFVSNNPYSGSSRQSLSYLYSPSRGLNLEEMKTELKKLGYQ